MVRSLPGLFALVALAAAPAFAQDAAPVGELALQSTTDTVHRDIRFSDDLGRKADIALVGVYGSSKLTFAVPEHWDIVGQPELHLNIARSSMLLPDVSSITVWLDGRPIHSFYLDGPAGQVSERVIPLPLTDNGGWHTLEFVGYHRSRLPCEITDHPGLWSRVLADSWVGVDYRPRAPELNLARWPFPIIDGRDPDPSRVVLVAPEGLSEPEAHALGYLASYLGRSAGWRPLDLYVHQGTPETAPAGHMIIVGRGDAPSAAVSTLLASMEAAADPAVQALVPLARSGQLDAAGALALMPRPDDPNKALLGVIGRDGPGLMQLASLLSGTVGSKLPTGSTQRVTEVKAADPMAERDWFNTVPRDVEFTLAELGIREKSTVFVDPSSGVADFMAEGFRGGTVTVPLNLVPDDRPIAGDARFELIYSYSAQADPDKSRVDVFLNGAAAGGVALKEIDGQNRARLLLEIPAHEMGPESRLDIVFSLLPREEPTCIGNERESMWGTVHADSLIKLPRNQWTNEPDLALLRFGGYPFGLRADLSDSLFVLGKDPSRTELQLFAWLAAEFGRVSRGDRFGYGVRVGSFEKARDGQKNVLVVEAGPEGSLIKSLGLLDRMSFTPKGAPGVSLALASGGLIALGADPKVAYIEQMALPWDATKTAVVAYAADATLFTRVGRCLSGQSLFDRLRGRVTRVASCADLAVIPSEQRRLLGQRPMKDAAYEPIRNNYWMIVGLLGVFVILMLSIRAFFIAWKRRQPGGEELPENTGGGA